MLLIQFLAGQWLDTFTPGEPKPGGFTITSPPSAALQAQDPYLELAVQRAPENPAAAWLWRPPEEILYKELLVRVGGSFVCPPAEGLENVRRIVLVAGGVGINPLMSILGYLSDERQRLGIHISVLYGTKLPENGRLGDILFLDNMVGTLRQESTAGKVRLFVTGSAPGADDRAKYEADKVEVKAGRMIDNDLLSELSTDEAGGTLVYICGPPAMTDHFVNMLTAPEMEHVVSAAAVKSEKWW